LQTSFYEQPSAPPETLNLPPAPGSAEEAASAAAAELDGLADVKIDDGSDDEDAVGKVGARRLAGYRLMGWLLGCWLVRC